MVQRDMCNICLYLSIVRKVNIMYVYIWKKKYFVYSSVLSYKENRRIKFQEDFIFITGSHPSFIWFGVERLEFFLMAQMMPSDRTVRFITEDKLPWLVFHGPGSTLHPNWAWQELGQTIESSSDLGRLTQTNRTQGMLMFINLNSY